MKLLVNVNMKLFNKIEKAIEETYYTQVHIQLLNSKNKSLQYLNWKEQFNDTKFINSKLVNITAGQNLCLTCCAYNISDIETDEVKVRHHFVIKKSMISDFVTFYGVIEYLTYYKNNEEVKGPKLYVLSPIGPFVEYFNEGWLLMKNLYPNSTYLHYTALNLEFEMPTNQKKTVLELFFRKEFNVFSNIIGEEYYKPK